MLGRLKESDYSFAGVFLFEMTAAHFEEMSTKKPCDLFCQVLWIAFEIALPFIGALIEWLIFFIVNKSEEVDRAHFSTLKKSEELQLNCVRLNEKIATGQKELIQDLDEQLKLLDEERILLEKNQQLNREVEAVEKRLAEPLRERENEIAERQQEVARREAQVQLQAAAVEQREVALAQRQVRAQLEIERLKALQQEIAQGPMVPQDLRDALQLEGDLGEPPQIRMPRVGRNDVP